MNKTIKDLTGQQFGRLTVIEYDATVKSNQGAHWKVSCSCGNTKTVRKTSLLSGRTKSCGCLNIEKSKELLPDNQAAYNSLYNSYKHGAKRRNYSFDIDMLNFRIMITQPCHYCGSEPTQIHRHAGTKSRSFVIYNGLDRIDNSLGYTVENTVTCCGRCNRAKDTMDYHEFISWIRRIYNHIGCDLC